jgi:general stress protein 26
MHETPEDIAALQRLIDESHAGAGRHLRSIFDDERRIPAADLPELLPGVQLLSLATVTAKGEPRVGPVDGLFFRAHFWFGSAHDSARFRHIRRNPAVSAAHTRGEELAVIVHGRAHETPLAERHPFRAYCLEVYGDAWFEFGEGAAYARIEPERMFTFRSR